MKEYVDVILPLPLPHTFTYLVPENETGNLQIGCRVVVPFGTKKYYTGVVCNIHHTMPAEYGVKEIAVVLDYKPIILPSQLQIWNWIADYYLCNVGDVYKASLPSGLKLESETIVTYKEDFVSDAILPEREQRILDILSVRKQLSATKLEKESGIKNILIVIKSLLDKGAVLVQEELKNAYKPKVETRVALGKEFLSEEKLKEQFDKLTRAAKQLSILMRFLELSRFAHGKCAKEVTKKQLLEKISSSTAAFNSLVEKGILTTYTYEIGRLRTNITDVSESNSLNSSQKKAYDQIIHTFGEKEVCLLHGVTSSGKTEIYIHLIQEVIKQGKQVLYMLPEIALTTQITERLRRVFGEKLGVYHSKFPDAERVEIWQKQLGTQRYDVILGARSSVFLPFQDLGLVIIDEEHENSYKQQDPAPRYHARSVGIMLASMYGAKTLLGTATPAVETYYNAIEGKYGLVELKERYQDIQLPEIIPVDIKELARKKQIKGLFSPLLLESIEDALSKKEQVILFQNRRGFAPMMECRTCGWIPKCEHCDVSLTYHKGIHRLTCHYCGSTYEHPRACPACGDTEIRSKGFGTEKVEDDIKLIFPEARVARMDLDTTRSRTAYEKIIADFQEGKTNILIGTQMISKGLDFDHVSTVGILNADNMLNYPDFRAYERAFQLMAQVAGRSGRKNKQGKVILQTRDLQNPVIHQVISNDYRQMINRELSERKQFRYPPYYRIIYVYLKSRRELPLDRMARIMADRLRTIFGDRVLGPVVPPVGRVQTLFIRKIMIKIESNASMKNFRSLLVQLQQEMLLDERFKSLVVYYDVDPQ